jgi:hypothetical protein
MKYTIKRQIQSLMKTILGKINSEKLIIDQKKVLPGENELISLAHYSKEVKKLS